MNVVTELNLVCVNFRSITCCVQISLPSWFPPNLPEMGGSEKDGVLEIVVTRSGVIYVYSFSRNETFTSKVCSETRKKGGSHNEESRSLCL